MLASRNSLRRWWWLLPTLLLLLRPAPASANPVNAEKLMSGPVHDGWKGSLETRLTLARGNVDRTDFATTGSLQFLTLFPEGAGHRRPPREGTPRFFRDRWVLITSGAFVRVGKRDDSGGLERSDIINRGFGHTRYTRMWIPRLGTEVFAQVQFNAFTRLRVRMIGGLGLRVDPVRTRFFQVWAGSGAMVEYELNDTIPGDPHPAEVINYRWTNYLALKLSLVEDRLVVQNTAYAQPLLTDFGDVRLLDALQLEGQVGENLAIGFDFQTQYDSRPPARVQRLDLTLGSYLRLGFG